MHTTLGEDWAKAFLDDIAEKHGKAKQLDDPDFKPPVVKLLAHNITYDLSFLWNHLARLNTVERGTSVVCGSCFYYKFGTELKAGPNKHLAEWMEKEGSRHLLLGKPSSVRTQGSVAQSRLWRSEARRLHHMS